MKMGNKGFIYLLGIVTGMLLIIGIEFFGTRVSEQLSVVAFSQSRIQNPGDIPRGDTPDFSKKPVPGNVYGRSRS